MINISDSTKARLKDILEWVYCVVIAVVLALIVRYFVGTPTVVKQPSMFPTLQENQRLILNRLERTFHKMPQRGDIVTFEAPSESYISYTEADLNNPVAVYNTDKGMNIFQKFTYHVLEIGKKSYIKRVIGLPNEEVKIENGYVYINGNKLEEDYLQEGIITDGVNGGVFLDIKVPDGYIFVLGDNRSASTDSRRFGCVPIEKLEGKVVLRFWPFDVFGKVE